MSTDSLVQQVVAAVSGLPLHRDLGIALVDPERPERGVTMPVGPATVNPSDMLHGGLVPLVLDVCSYLALLPQLGPERHAVTVSTTCSLLAGVPLGEVVRAEATVERAGRTTAFMSARLLHGERVVATGQVVKAVLPAPAAPAG